MKIIVPGRRPNTTHRLTCTSCHCYFEFEQSEAKVSPDPKDMGRVLSIECPFCYKTLFLQL